ncbi:BatD family protein [Methanolobus profundi]|uniref:Conserved repeat domain-containing protein n=1 Tax=Methanolobus profundi TaxID=487685 RepID=A0A1I4TTH0_9EURY|nr:BatD family protein [Methanolobus profundi]SFM79971.1 conserved repeat domain-containing protein [Methanolobus profundi]
MVRTTRLLTFTLCMIFFCIAMAGNASAAVELYNGSITTGDGYQVNNFVIELTDAFPSAESASFYVYNNGNEVDDFLVNEDDSYEFDFEDDATIEVTLLSVSSGTLPVARVSIVLNNYLLNDVFESGVVDGGYKYAVYSGTPELKITKTIDKSDISAGDLVRVTVTVENVGDDKATDVIFQEPQQAKFLLYESFVSQTGETTVEVGESKTIFVYQLKATEEGTYTLSPTTATFSNNAGADFPQASSNSPVITVEKGEDLVNADIEFTTTLDKYTVSRNEDIQGTIKIKNTGDTSATGVTVNIQVPEGLEFTGGSGVETISGVPTIYLESFGVQQEKEFTFTLKAAEVGTYTISTENSYLYDNGIDAQLQKVTSDQVTNSIYVTKGKYDHLLEQPIYIYVVPLVIIGAIAGWIYYRHKQYKF